MKVRGKVALVTGAAQGLGKAFAASLLENGAKVLFSDVNSEKGQETLKEFEKKFGQENVAFVKCDVTSQADMEAVFQQVRDRFGGLDIMCNNAGIGGESREMWEKTVDINLKGMIRGTYLAMDVMRQDKGGRGGVIVNVASMAGINPNPFGPVYCATKFGIVGFSRSWALNPECTGNGIRINMLCPAFADTALVADIDNTAVGSPTAAKEFIDKIGIMTPEYVAEGFLDLVQDETKNGAVLKMGKSFGKVYHEY
ncbi:15-hydroxyprostaglandin dehydrogenase [NAD(+)]-like [Haliotis rubra]|uniref:15-hydroxyprostaglandin dehydrogenase [NAD(+)]-like n=1 Tax=Haliotis rubra TaxID=36100 RepID=UPI001EE53BDF|nr:15-hydroxyprostaglandin dehydrogenase [NAD(+)]-like [Haliotis rubra]